jgi:hypothetical protein
MPHRACRPRKPASIAGDTRGNPPKARGFPGFPRTPFPPFPPAQGRAPRATTDSNTTPTPAQTETSPASTNPQERPAQNRRPASGHDEGGTHRESAP